MKTHSEVNFEKRGKLEDHQNCPICKCCVCDKHKKCSPFPWIVTFFLLTFAFLLPFPASAAEAPYNFSTVDIEITGYPDAVVWLRDVNIKGQILASTFWTDPQGNPVWGSLIGKLNLRQNKLTGVEFFFDCFGARINNRGGIVGQAEAGACVRRPNGQVIVLSAVPQGVGFGISNDRVSGTYCTPNGPPNFGCTGHGFTWNPVEDYRTIDLVGQPGTHIRVAPLAPNNRGQLLIEYFVASDNAAIGDIEHGFCIFEAGNCGPPIALSFNIFGGPSVSIPDFNDEGQAIALRSDNTGTTLQLYDEGFLDIEGLPAGWLLSSLEGMSDEAAFVGAYRVQIGVDPFYGTPILERHDFIATPLFPIQVVKK